MKSTLKRIADTCESGSVALWRLEANQADHGSTSVICDQQGSVVAHLPCQVWNASGRYQNPEEAAVAALFLAAPQMYQALLRAQNALKILSEAYEAETETTEAGGWSTDALEVVSAAIESVHSAPKSDASPQE